MKAALLLIAVVLTSSLYAAVDDQTINAYETIAAKYPALIQNLFKNNQDEQACQKAYVLDLTREAFQSETLGPKLQQLDMFVYRNFTMSFGQLKTIVDFCRNGGDRATAIQAADELFSNSLLE